LLGCFLLFVFKYHSSNKTRLSLVSVLNKANGDENKSAGSALLSLHLHTGNPQDVKGVIYTSDIIFFFLMRGKAKKEGNTALLQ